MTPSRELLIYELAEQQDSLVTRTQLYALGVPKSTVDRWVGAGIWRDLGLGTLLAPGVRPLPRHTLRAATLSLRGAVVSHGSAGLIHGFPLMSHQATVSVPLRTTHRFPGVHVHESSDLREVDVMETGGLPVTTPPRTVFDLAAVLPDRRLVRVVEDGLAAGRFTLDELVATFHQLARRGKRGIAKMRRLLDDLGDSAQPPMSELEARFRDLVEASGLPIPTGQYRPPWYRGKQGIVDYSYPDHLLVIELDSRRWHLRSDAFEEDRRRDNAAVLAGWRVLRFTWDDVVRRPEYVLTTLRTALGGDP